MNSAWTLWGYVILILECVFSSVCALSCCGFCCRIETGWGKQCAAGEIMALGAIALGVVDKLSIRTPYPDKSGAWRLKGKGNTTLETLEPVPGAWGGMLRKSIACLQVNSFVTLDSHNIVTSENFPFPKIFKNLIWAISAVVHLSRSTVDLSIDCRTTEVVEVSLLSTWASCSRGLSLEAGRSSQLPWPLWLPSGFKIALGISGLVAHWIRIQLHTIAYNRLQFKRSRELMAHFP